MGVFFLIFGIVTLMLGVLASIPTSIAQLGFVFYGLLLIVIGARLEFGSIEKKKR